MKRQYILWILLVVMTMFVAKDVCAQSKDCVEVETTAQLKIIKPQFSAVDLVFGDDSPKDDKSVIACFGAAFTGERLLKFSHNNIAGPHAGGGKKYKGYSCPRNTGAFVYSNGSWEFLYGGYKNKNYDLELSKAAKNGGCGFEQEMVVFKNQRVETTRHLDNENIFRVLCDKDGELLIVESTASVAFGDFIDSLMNYGVDNALYLDMGTWRYGWYRPTNDTIEELQPRIHNFHTNWLIFKK